MGLWRKTTLFIKFSFHSDSCPEFPSHLLVSLPLALFVRFTVPRNKSDLLCAYNVLSQLRLSHSYVPIAHIGTEDVIYHT
jgi:hypothetical protein